MDIFEVEVMSAECSFVFVVLNGDQHEQQQGDCFSLVRAPLIVTGEMCVVGTSQPALSRLESLTIRRSANIM